jgi:hypothetical protein
MAAFFLNAGVLFNIAITAYKETLARNKLEKKCSERQPRTLSNGGQYLPDPAGLVDHKDVPPFLMQELPEIAGRGFRISGISSTPNSGIPLIGANPLFLYTSTVPQEWVGRAGRRERST